MSASFIGLAPWPNDVDVIECVLDGGHLIDLHNFGQFSGIHIAPGTNGDIVILEFDFDPKEARERGLTANHVELLFAEVSGLSVAHDEPWEAEASTQVEGWSHRSIDEEDISELEFEFGNLTIRFCTSRVEIRASYLNEA